MGRSFIHGAAIAAAVLLLSGCAMLEAILGGTTTTTTSRGGGSPTSSTGSSDSRGSQSIRDLVDLKLDPKPAATPTGLKVVVEYLRDTHVGVSTLIDSDGRLVREQLWEDMPAILAEKGIEVIALTQDREGLSYLQKQQAIVVLACRVPGLGQVTIPPSGPITLPQLDAFCDLVEPLTGQKIDVVGMDGFMRAGTISPSERSALGRRTALANHYYRQSVAALRAQAPGPRHIQAVAPAARELKAKWVPSKQ